MNRSPVLDEGQIQRLREWGGTDLQRKMIELFLEHAVVRVHQIREGLASEDLKAAEIGSHTLKSSAGNVGARRLQQLANDAEVLASSGDLEELRKLFPSLESEFESACRALRNVKEGLGQ